MGLSSSVSFVRRKSCIWCGVGVFVKKSDEFCRAGFIRRPSSNLLPFRFLHARVMTLESYVTYKSVSNTCTLYALWMTDSCKGIGRLISDSGSHSWLAALTLATPLLLYSLSSMLTNDAAKWCTDNVGRMFTRGREASRCVECQQFVHCHSFIRAILFIQVYYQCIVLSCSIVDLSTKSKFVNKSFIDAS